VGLLALSPRSRVLLDTMCFIYVVEEIDPYRHLMRPVFTGIDTADLTAAVSVVALSEVLTKPLRDRDTDLARRFRDLLLHTNGVSLVPVDAVLAEQAADLRARYGLRTPDALHIATAPCAGCDHILTNDPAWKRVTEIDVLILDEVLALP